MGYSPWGRRESDTTEQLTHRHTHTPEMWEQANPKGVASVCVWKTHVRLVSQGLVLERHIVPRSRDTEMGGRGA